MKKKILIVATSAFLFTATMVNAATKTIKPILTTDNRVTLDVSPFCMAIIKGDIETVRKLIEFGEDVNEKSLGMTPVIYAARYNKVDILELLIANGANLKIKCDKGRSAVKYAEMSNAKEALVVLEKAIKETKRAKKK